MDIRTFIKQFIPPILLELYRSVRSNMWNTYAWEGMYPHYRDVPASGPGYSSDSYINQAVADTRNAIGRAKHYGAVPTEVVGEHVLLPLLAAVVGQRNGEKLRILDFGGGTGTAYVHLLSGLVKYAAVDYHIVDLEKLVRAGSRLFEHDGRIHFHSSLPDHLSDIDIVYISGALQYIEDYAGFLKTLCACQPKYFLITRLLAGDFPTYATAQRNMPGSVIPYWFFNMTELVGLMKQGGYALIFKGGVEEPNSQNNFPAQYRVACELPCTLLFARS